MKNRLDALLIRWPEEGYLNLSTFLVDSLLWAFQPDNVGPALRELFERELRLVKVKVAARKNQ